ncbi:MAG: protein translocase subunit SecD [Planctomycetota bacterium]
MLENARNQFFLVILAILLGAVCIFTMKPTLGPDLKGGTQLLYDVPKDVLQIIQQKENVSVDQVMGQTIGVMRERIDPNGTLDPLITRSGETGILIELAEMPPQTLKRVLERIGNLGKLEMRMVAYGDYKVGNVSFNLQMERQKLEGWLRNPDNLKKVNDEPRNIRIFNEDPFAGPNAAGSLAWYPRLVRPEPNEPTRWGSSFTMGALREATVKAWSDAEFNKGLVPESFLEKPERDRYLLEYVAVNMVDTSFTGEDLNPSGVGVGIGRNGGNAVNYELINARKGDYLKWSGDNKDKSSAIILNGVIKSAPYFRGKIPGRGIIEGDFTEQEVKELVKVLRTGSLRVEPELLSQQTIGAQLGERAISNGLISIIGGGLLVFLFMLAYYRTAGTIACISLLINMLLLYAGMLFMQATITLPGLGGIVLTLGMAVDANVLIYERIREELQKGKEMLQAVRSGFERAMSAILDSNITTFLVGLVLFNVGVGPVRGFAVTLMVGIITTVFTQFFVSRLLFHYALSKNKLDGWQPRTLFENRNVDFVGKIKVCVVLSALLIIGGIGYATTVPAEKMLGIDFTGGANLRMVLSSESSDEDVRATLAADEAFVAKYPTTSVNTVGESGNEFNVRLKLNETQRGEIAKGRAAWRDAKKQALAANEDPPAAYQPPYIGELERMFGAELVQPAFSDPLLTKHDRRPETLLYAQINVHFTSPVSVAEFKQKLTLAQGDVFAVDKQGADQAGATEATDFRVEWTTPATTKQWELKGIVSNVVSPADGDDNAETSSMLKDTDGELITLSDPFPEAQEIQGRLVNDLRNAAIGALLLAWALIVFYLRVRFHEYKYGLAAVVALIHDVLVTFGVVVLCNNLGLVNAEISLSMIACFLTIIGYSVNDTIVVFDRIRENRIDNARHGKDESFRSLINRSLNQTLSRTVLTTVLTLFVVIAQLLVNYGSGSDLEGFAFAMTIGMCCGVYSTMFIAAPILIWMDRGDPVEVPDDPRDADREGDFDNEAEIAAQQEAAEAAAAAAEKNA